MATKTISWSDSSEEYVICRYSRSIASQEVPQYSRIDNAVFTTQWRTNIKVGNKCEIYTGPEGDYDSRWETIASDSTSDTNYRTITVSSLQRFFASETVNSGLIYNNGVRGWIIIRVSGLSIRTSYIKDTSLTLTYTPPIFTVSGSVNNNAYGTVQFPSGNSGTVGETSITMNAVANYGYKFVNWSDGNTSASRTVTVSSSEISAFSTTKSYTANFAPITYSVTYNGNGATSGSVSSQSSVSFANNLTLSANSFVKKYTVTLNSNYSGGTSSSLNSTAAFVGWEDWGNITASSGRVFTYTEFDAPFYANTYGDLYAAFGYNKLSLVNHYVSNGISEGRSATGSPRGTYPAGAVVNSLTASDGYTVPLYAQWSQMSPVTLPTMTRSGYRFLGWYTASEGGTRVGGAGDSYTPSANITLYARWQLLTYTVTVTAQSGGTVTGGGIYAYGTTVTITATANTGYEFVGWSDGNIDAQRQITVTGDAAYTALFEQTAQPPSITNVQMLYNDAQISSSNKVRTGQGYIIKIKVE